MHPIHSLGDNWEKFRIVPPSYFRSWSYLTTLFLRITLPRCILFLRRAEGVYCGQPSGCLSNIRHFRPRTAGFTVCLTNQMIPACALALWDCTVTTVGLQSYPCRAASNVLVGIYDSLSLQYSSATRSLFRSTIRVHILSCA